MEITFFVEYGTNGGRILKWYAYLEKSELRFKEEIRQEIGIGLMEQYGGQILY